MAASLKSETQVFAGSQFSLVVHAIQVLFGTG